MENHFLTKFSGQTFDNARVVAPQWIKEMFEMT